MLTPCLLSLLAKTIFQRRVINDLLPSVPSSRSIAVEAHEYYICWTSGTRWMTRMSHWKSSQMWTMNQYTDVSYEATDLRQTKHLRLSVFQKNTTIWQPNTTSGTFASGTRSNNDLLFNSIFIHVNPWIVARTSDSLSNHYTKLLQVIQIPSVVTHNQWTWSFRKRIM